MFSGLHNHHPMTWIIILFQKLIFNRVVWNSKRLLWLSTWDMPLSTRVWKHFLQIFWKYFLKTTSGRGFYWTTTQTSGTWIPSQMCCTSCIYWDARLRQKPMCIVQSCTESKDTAQENQRRKLEMVLPCCTEVVHSPGTSGYVMYVCLTHNSLPTN